jgi:hypothetical protein
LTKALDAIRKALLDGDGRRAHDCIEAFIASQRKGGGR